MRHCAYRVPITEELDHGSNLAELIAGVRNQCPNAVCAIAHVNGEECLHVCKLTREECFVVGQWLKTINIGGNEYWYGN